MPNISHKWLNNCPEANTRYVETQGPHGSPDPFECWLLSKLAQDANVILEIGTWRGRSATFLSYGNPKARLVCVDHFAGDTTGGAGADRIITEETFSKFGVTAEIIQENALTLDWSKVLPIPVDLVFYDGDHTFDATVKVLKNLHPFIIPNGRVAIHDAQFPEVDRAIKKLTNSGLYYKSVYIQIWEGFAILQRI